MKVIYYSELTNKNYASEEACLNAEYVFKAQQRQAEKHKQKLADEIDNAAKVYDEARITYNELRGKVEEILNKSNKECEDLLAKADRIMYDAYAKYQVAVAKFNETFGEYTTIKNNGANLCYSKGVNSIIDEFLK